MTQHTVAMDMTTACLSFPEPLDHELLRDNLLNDVETTFNDGASIVIVEGAEGIGKTTFLSQFARRHRHDTISIFIEPGTPWAYDPEFIKRDLANQLFWMFEQREIGPEDHVSEFSLRDLWYQLRRRARKRNCRYYFVIDGLLDLPIGDEISLKTIVAMLPVGLKTFCFLISGKSSRLSPYVAENLAKRTFHLTSLTKHETASLLSGVVDDENCLEEFYSTCHGVPGRLAAVRRILDAGKDCHTLLREMPNHLPGLFEIEWRQVSGYNLHYLQALAIIAQESKRRQVEDLARMVDLDKEEVTNFLSKLTFIRLTTDTHEVSFVSEPFRRFAYEQLRQYHATVNSLTITDLSSDPSSEAALLQLPSHYQQASRFEELIDFLSISRISQMLQRMESVVPVVSSANLGLDAAINLSRDSDALKFGLYLSTVDELSSAEIWRSEIEACMALGDDTSAVALAESVLLAEDRLHLLSIIARAKLSQGLTPEPEVDEQIRSLYSQIDHKLLGKRAAEIAADLAFFDPDMAISMVENAASTEDSDNALDFALAKVSILAMFESERNRERNRLTEHEDIHARIKDSHLRAFITAFTPFVKRLDAQQVIAEAERMSNPGDKLFLLSRWTQVNRKNSTAVSVVDYALQIAIRATGFVPSARTVRAVAAPLPFISNFEESMRLVSIFDGQQTNIEHRGPAEDYVRLQLILSETERRYNPGAAHSRLVDIFIYVRAIQDVSSRATCMTYIIGADRSDGGSNLLASDELESLLQDLELDISQLLNGTAEHYLVTKSIIDGLATANPRIAVSIASRLNMPDRRDRAYLRLIQSMMRTDIQLLDFNLIDDVLGRIWLKPVRDQALITVLERLSSAEHDDVVDYLQDVVPLLNQTTKIEDAESRCRATCLAYTIALSGDSRQYSSLATHLLKQSRHAWEAIDASWSRSDLGFVTAGILAPYSLAEAKEQMNLNRGMHDETTLYSRRAASAYATCAGLVIRAFIGLLPKKADQPRDSDALARMINLIPSRTYRAQMWGDVALGYALAGRGSECRMIVNQHIRPLLQDISLDDHDDRAATLAYVSPAIYYSRSDSLEDHLSGLDEWVRDDAYDAVSKTITRKHLPLDEYEDGPRQIYDLSIDDIRDLCRLIRLMSRDSLIYGWIRLIADCIVYSSGRNLLSAEQKSFVVTELNQIISAQLPNRNYIEHDGFKIAAYAEVARITSSKREVWEHLIQQARKIPNTADAVYVLGVIGSTMPSREAPLRSQTLREAKERTEQIPAILDQIERYELLASLTLDVDPDFPRSCLKSAFEVACLSNEDADYAKAQHRIVDLAYKLDPKFASSLTVALDNDPARDRSRANVAARLDIQKQKSQLIEDITNGNILRLPDEENLIDLAWMLLGALTAKRIGTAPLDHMYLIIKAAAKHPLHISQPVMQWIVENAVRRWGNTEQAYTDLRRIFDATLEGTEMAFMMAQRSARQLREIRTHNQQVHNNTAKIVRSGEREQAIAYLTNWLKSNARQYLKICDPYFGPEQLEVLQLLCSVNEVCQVHDVYLLTSKKHHDDQRIDNPAFSYNTHWRIHLSDENPPHTEVVIVNKLPGGGLPLHDRYWITQDGGLRMGTSFKDLGRKRDSEISLLNSAEAREREDEIDQYLKRLIREHGGARVTYELFEI